MPNLSDEKRRAPGVLERLRPSLPRANKTPARVAPSENPHTPTKPPSASYSSKTLDSFASATSQRLLHTTVCSAARMRQCGVRALRGLLALLTLTYRILSTLDRSIGAFGFAVHPNAPA
eukprot:scaffold4595_cov415-Prasinococcus_capsulatus_cf.AAC.2